MLATPRSLSRRSVFRLTATAALTAAGLAAAAGCSSGEDTAATVDALTTHLRLARTDAATAGALIAVLPDRAGALGVVQAERSAHADALAAEIDRVSGAPSTTASSATTPPAVTAPTLDGLRSSLNDSARGAASSARDESGYRAGLLGSISAACTVQTTVVLA